MGSSVASQVFLVHAIGPCSTLRGMDSVCFRDLAAVLTPVPFDEYGPEALERNAADLEWLTQQAVDHERAIQRISRLADVVPLRFGAVYSSKDQVERFVAERYDDLMGLLKRLEGTQEWGMTIYQDVNMTLALARTQAKAEDSPAPPGQAYLMRKKAEAAVTQQAGVMRREVLADAQSVLKETCEEVKVEKVGTTELSPHGEPVGKLALLIAKDRFEAFRAAAADLGKRHSAAGFTLELVGPWPPYSFARFE